MDIAPINLEITEDNNYNLDCNMPNFGSQSFTIISRGDSLFMRYQDYPLVSMAVGIDLLAGTNCPYEIKIIESFTSGDIITKDNISEFYVGMIEK